MKISDKKKKEMLRTMILSRKFSDSLVELFKIEGKIPGMMILSTGQEAVGSGVCAALAPDDVIITNHRSHHHLLAKGADPKAIMAEIYCRKTGCNKGKSGTLHLAMPGLSGMRSIQGSSILRNGPKAMACREPLQTATMPWRFTRPRWKPDTGPSPDRGPR
jgi:TPP-dependent pyruvate/acetoin dehydrogenase alpha subunit